MEIFLLIVAISLLYIIAKNTAGPEDEHKKAQDAQAKGFVFITIVIGAILVFGLQALGLDLSTTFFVSFAVLVASFIGIFVLARIEPSRSTVSGQRVVRFSDWLNWEPEQKTQLVQEIVNMLERHCPTASELISIDEDIIRIDELSADVPPRSSVPHALLDLFRETLDPDTVALERISLLEQTWPFYKPIFDGEGNEDTKEYKVTYF